MKHSRTPNQRSSELEEYEQIINEQKKRINTLRDEKRELAEILSHYEGQKEMISGAMINAENTSQKMIENAKRTAIQILSDANKKAEWEETRLTSYRRQLLELDDRCEKILADIRSHLAEEDHHSLGIVVGGRQ